MLNFWRNKKSHASFEPDNYKEAILNINCELQISYDLSLRDDQIVYRAYK